MDGKRAILRSEVWFDKLFFIRKKSHKFVYIVFDGSDKKTYIYDLCTIKSCYKQSDNFI